jgi:hypothetical protein
MSDKNDTFVERFRRRIARGSVSLGSTEPPLEPYCDPAWQDSRDLMQARAWRFLKHSALLKPSISRNRPFNGLPQLRLWREPGGLSEAGTTTINVFEIVTEEGKLDPVVRETVWNQSTDYKKLRDSFTQSRSFVVIEPTMAVRDGPVPKERLQDLLREANAFKLPMTWFDDAESITSDSGIDMIEFFSRDQPPASLRLKWSNATPPEWEPIIEWVERLRTFLMSCLLPPKDQR